VPLACSARWDRELEGAERSTSWILRTVASMSVVMIGGYRWKRHRERSPVPGV
jgi:hypothetical protein